MKSCIIQSRQSSVRTGLLWSFFIYYQYIFHFIGTSQDNPDICAILLLLRVFNRLTPKRTLLPSVRMLFYKSWMLFHKSCNTVFQNGLWWHNWVPRLLSASYKLNDSSSPCVILWWSIGVPNNDIQGECASVVNFPLANWSNPTLFLRYENMWLILFYNYKNETLRIAASFQRNLCLFRYRLNPKFSKVLNMLN